YDYYNKALDKGWHVAPSNNQDNHKGKWGDANTARTVVIAPTLNYANSCRCNNSGSIGNPQKEVGVIKHIAVNSTSKTSRH
ncbi:MAG: hypothetical protein RSA78_08640, partial [Oscillospiraceae bacterium]